MSFSPSPPQGRCRASRRRRFSEPLTSGRGNPGREPLRPRRAKGVRRARGRPARAVPRAGEEKRPIVPRRPIPRDLRTAGSPLFRLEKHRRGAGRDRERDSLGRVYFLQGFHPSAALCKPGAGRNVEERRRLSNTTAHFSGKSCKACWACAPSSPANLRPAHEGPPRSLPASRRTSSSLLSWTGFAK